MKTFQDFEKLTSEEQRKSFILEAINEHKSSSNYKTAKEAGEYDRQLNTEIMKYQKYLKNLQGGKIVDIFSPNNKIASNFFNQFTNQENQYELSNGVDWSEDENADEIVEKLGNKFDTQLQKGGKNALLGGTSYGFFNNGKLLFFGVTEFVPLIDELNGELRAGIRFWQLDNEKPLMITLYEEDGVTEYSGNSKGLKSTKEKTAYITITEATKISESIKETKNYSRLPIIPLYSGQHHDSRLVGMKNTIDLYDRIFSEFGNDFDRYQQIYWVFKNCGGMDGNDIQEFMSSMKVFGGAKAGDDDGSDATAHTIEIPYQARQIALDMLEKRMYKDYGAIDISNLSSNATQDEINSKYLPLDLKVDEFEYCIIEFLEKLLGMLGFENINPKFHRDKMESEKNKADLDLIKAQTKQIDAQTLLTLDSYLDDETFIKMLIDHDIIDEDDLIEMEKDTDIMKFVKDLVAKKQLEADSRVETDNVIDDEEETATESIDNKETSGQTVTTGEIEGQVQEVAQKSLNGAQTQSLLAVMEQFSSGSLTLQQAINITAIAIGVSKEEAKKIIEGVE